MMHLKAFGCFFGVFTKVFIEVGLILGMITLLVVGKIKDQHMNGLIEEYTKRLSSFTKFELLEIAPEKIMVEGEKGKELIKEVEGRKILKILEKKQQKKPLYIIVLDENGRTMSSEQLAVCVKEKELEGDMVFIIGGALGLSDEVKQKAQLNLSFSRMTFAHGMIRVFLLEQIYRAYTINKGMPYHK